MGELEKLGGKYKVALRLAKDHALNEFPATAGCYADDCITNMAVSSGDVLSLQHVIRVERTHSKIPGVPCMYVSGYRYTVERMPEAFGARDNTTMWCIDRSKSVDY
jgi:U3 small nucleolar RNA-associated protein 24